MKHDIMLVYTPQSLVAQKTCTSDIAKDSSTLCKGFEIVRIRTLYDILPNAVFICSDNFAWLLKKEVNRIGTMLYANDYHILGNICIAKEIDTVDGHELIGLTDDEANKIAELIDIKYRTKYGEQ